MTIRAKFKVDKVEPTHATDGYTITLNPVISGSKENEDFYKWTPGGQILLSTINADAAVQFAKSKEMYVDFIPAD